VQWRLSTGPRQRARWDEAITRILTALTTQQCPSGGWPELLDLGGGELRHLDTGDELDSAEARHVFCLPRRSSKSAGST
jgi:hypothetical protein